MLDLVIKGGQVVTPQAVGEMDVGIQGEKIVAVGWSGTLAADAGRVIDATGKIVMPGGIEPHAHIGNNLFARDGALGFTRESYRELFSQPGIEQSQLFKDNAGRLITKITPKKIQAWDFSKAPIGNVNNE